jgi:hypothetical protein
MAHTPGPWQLADNDPTLVITTALNAGGHATIVADVLTHEGVATEETLDNGLLVAAAPDMLLALKWAEDYLGGWPADDHQRACREAVRAAIAKATQSRNRA